MSILRRKKEAHDIAYAAEEGKQKAQLKWIFIRWGGAAVIALAVVFGGWMLLKSTFSSAANAVTPCFATSEKDCGLWAHPGQWGWFDGGKEDKGPQQSTPASQTATAPQSTPVKEPVDTRPCANDWIPGSCYWDKRETAEEE